MLEKLAQIEKNYEELTEQISSPEIMSDMKAYARVMKQHSNLGEIVEKIRAVRKMQEDLQGARDIVEAADDEEMREMAGLEIAEIEEKLNRRRGRIKSPSSAERSERRKERYPRNTRRNGRRRGDAFRCRDPSDVCPVCRAAGLENGDPRNFGYGRRGYQGRHGRDRGR